MSTFFLTRDKKLFKLNVVTQVLPVIVTTITSHNAYTQATDSYDITLSLMKLEMFRVGWFRGHNTRHLSAIGIGAAVMATLIVTQLNITAVDFKMPLDYKENITTTLTAFTIKESLLNDKTVVWDPYVDRMWLDTRHEQNRPPAMLLLTSYGWNRFNQTVALSNYSRQTRESEFLDGIVNHPWFHPTVWDDIENGNGNVTIQSILGLNNNNNNEQITSNITTRFYIFFDLSSNCDVHYPKYFTFDGNLDTSGGRVNVSSNRMDNPHETLEHPIWKSRFITQLGHQNLNQVKLIYFDCNPESDPTFAERRRQVRVPVVVAHITGTIARSDETIDMGLVPPLLNKAVALNQTEVESIYSCAADFDDNLRPYYLTYTGNFRSGKNGGRFPARAGFAQINDNKRMFGLRYFLDEFKESSIANVTYEDILKRSIYSGAPRGDNKYSYRFTEVLASGGIPIVMADDWMLPFRPELVHWDECIILLPEKELGLKMLKYIAPITAAERCERRKKCYDIYRNYIETGQKVIDGIVQGLELVALGFQENMTAIHCDPRYPDSDDCNPLR